MAEREPAAERAARRHGAGRRRREPAAPTAGGNGERSSDLGARLVVAIPAIAFALFVILAGEWIFAIAAIGLGLVCLHELFRMYAAVRPARLAGFLAVIGLGLAADLGEQRHVLLALVASVPAVFLIALAMPDVERRTAGMSITLLGVIWVGGAIAHAIMLSELPHGQKVMIIILIGTFVGDTAAYLGGRAFGRSRLAPSISPNKTLEGLVLGLFGAVVATLLGKLYADWMTFGEGALLGLAVAIAAPLGDLFESQVKRDAGTKDAGSLFGVHGGALDRLDAALFTLTAGYYVWYSMTLS